MKVTIIHGDHLEKSRERYGRIISGVKKKGFNIVRLNEKGLQLTENLVSQPLFMENVIYIHDKANEIGADEIRWIKKNANMEGVNVLLWYKGDAPKKLTGAFGTGANIEHFPLPKLLFNFLDSFYPGSSTDTLSRLHELLAHEPIELVLHMLSIRLRDIYWAKNDPESMKGNSWYIGKLKAQANKFTGDKLKNIIYRLSEIDIMSKSTDTKTATLLDLLILKELE